MEIAEIENPALSGGLGDASTPEKAGSVLAQYIGILWMTAVVLGGLALLVYMVIAGFSWVMAGGDKNKVEKAREMITQGVIGMVVLVSIAAVSAFLSKVFGINLLAPVFQNNL